MGLMSEAGLDDTGMRVYIEDFGLCPKRDG